MINVIIYHYCPVKVDESLSFLCTAMRFSSLLKAWKWPKMAVWEVMLGFLFKQYFLSVFDVNAPT